MVPSGRKAARLPRVAMLLLPGLDHFAPDLLAGLPDPELLDLRGFPVRSPADLQAALAWTDDPAQDSVWFEFCWPPFPEWIARTDFGGRRVVVRVHRIEAYGTDHAARAPWWKVDDVVVVGPDMARRLHAAVPTLEPRTRLHVVPNGVDLTRFGAAPPAVRDPFRIGWCGWVSLHKNPILAIEVLGRLRRDDPRWTLHLASKGGEAVAVDSLRHLIQRNGLQGAVRFDGAISQAEMPAWHARNAVLLSTSHYESFGYAIAEAAAAGCDLAVLDHPGADETWPAPVLFGTAQEACAVICAARPDRWRQHVRRFALDRQIEASRALLLAPRAAPDTVAGRDGVPVQYGTWTGRFPVRDAADHVQSVVARTGRFYEEEMLADIQARLPRGGLFVDVGANVGNHALFAAGVCGAQVLAFEPSPKLADQCRDALAANGLSDRLSLRRKGVGAAPARAALVPGPPGNAGMTSLDLDGDDGIEVVRLDDALEAEPTVLHPSVIKVDVEGMECDVLLGAAATLQRCRPALYVETATDDQFEAVSAVAAMMDYRPVRRFNATPTWLFLPAA